MDIVSLKKYIYENKKIDFILNELKCWNIKYHENKEYYSASFPDGDNLQGINIRNNPYLNYRSFSRNVSYEDNEDLGNIESIKGLFEKNYAARNGGAIANTVNISTINAEFKNNSAQNPC